MNGFYPPLTIRFFSFQHISINCEVDIPSHGPRFWEPILIYNKLLYVQYLWSHSTPINEFFEFCVVCPSSDHFGAQNFEMQK